MGAKFSGSASRSTAVFSTTSDNSASVEEGCKIINDAFAQYGVQKSIPVLSLTKPGMQAVEPLAILLPDGNSFVTPLPIEGNISLNGVSETNLDAVAALRAKIAQNPDFGEEGAEQAIIIESNGVLFWTDGDSIYVEHNGDACTTLNVYIIAVILKQADGSKLDFFAGETITVHLASNALILSTFTAPAQ